MALNKIIRDGKSRGFTIVELLIVIVVIGILAAITIVAYGGITARANTVKAQTNAANVQKVGEAYNADNGAYPTLAQLTAYNGSTSIPTGIAVTAAAPTSANGLTTLGFVPLSTTGGCIAYWNFGLATPAVNYVYIGNAKTGGAGTCA